ncbi:hypothetical protein ACYE2N_01630 [Flavobacterium sp. MAHUQ-51]|uniref:hypothetical protein n=1 Tax=Flavobacterium sp. GCM10022190 TaxID=3252639 RepID=UPI00361F1231
MKIKDFLEGQKAMYLFKKGYTYYPRWLEIGFGIIGWFGIFLILFSLMKLIFSN